MTSPTHDKDEFYNPEEWKKTSLQLINEDTHDKEIQRYDQIESKETGGIYSMQKRKYGMWVLYCDLQNYIEQLRRDAVADVSKYYINLLVKQKEETKKELLDECINIVEDSPVLGNDKHGFSLIQYAHVIDKLQNIRAKTLKEESSDSSLGEQVKKE